MKQARIAVMMPRFSRYGGAEGFGYRLAEALGRAGHAVDFICARAEVEPPAGVRPVVVGRFGPFKWLKVVWFALAAERARKQGRYDLAVGLGKTLRQDVFRQGGGPLPVFWALSGRAWPAGPQRAFKALRRRLSLANWAGWWIERVQARTTPVLVANSELTRQWMLEAHPFLRAEQLPVIYNRPDLDRFSPPDAERRLALRREAGVGPDQVLLLTAGTNFMLKGVRTLLEALALLPERYVLHVAGGRGAGRWVKLARKLGVEGRVRFLGRVEDMPSFYATGDLFVLPTFYDACSNAIMEALASGLRVISSACNGSAAFLPPENVLDDPADSKALAHLAARVANGPAPGEFVWPDRAQSGMDAWVALVNDLLERKAHDER
ncbi:glycosyltransferase family 4 protein [Paucidesulfovibrio longus]|uniref:glycosyltransferase family 4 protein n=1 Tax=Paucidesulfovibrio longus TaxID=889 RepID=UPI0003B33233|nr:glycosyltransferase family 4 protein [Paucidesulfovibrio longus]